MRMVPFGNEVRREASDETSIVSLDLSGRAHTIRTLAESTRTRQGWPVRGRQSDSGGTKAAVPLWYDSPPPRSKQRAHHEEDDDDDDEDDDQRGDWDNDRVGGDYLRGVGYDDDRQQRPRTKERFSDMEDVRFPSRGWKERVRRARSATKRARRHDFERDGIDGSGRLVFEGGVPRRRWALRAFEMVGPAIVCSTTIAASFVNSSSSSGSGEDGEEGRLPGSGTVAVWTMRLFPFVSIAVSVYVLIVRPLRKRQLAKKAASLHEPANGGYFVPELKKGNGSMPARYVPAKTTVNVKLDASFLKAIEKAKQRSKHASESSDEEDEQEDEEEDDVWSDGSEPAGGRRYRRAILSQVAGEQKWREARRELKVLTAVDCLLSFVWALVAIYVVGFGERCPVGASGQYCNLYNVGLAFSVLTSVLFVGAVCFDIKDLRQSRIPPRLRTQSKSR